MVATMRAHHRPCANARNAYAVATGINLKRRLNARHRQSPASSLTKAETAVQEFSPRSSRIRCDTGLYNADQATATICYEYTTSRLPPFRLRGANGRFSWGL